jgi:hypothetical protein
MARRLDGLKTETLIKSKAQLAANRFQVCRIVVEGVDLFASGGMTMYILFSTQAASVGDCAFFNLILISL